MAFFGDYRQYPKFKKMVPFSTNQKSGGLGLNYKIYKSLCRSMSQILISL